MAGMKVVVVECDDEVCFVLCLLCVVFALLCVCFALCLLCVVFALCCVCFVLCLLCVCFWLKIAERNQQIKMQIGKC